MNDKPSANVLEVLKVLDGNGIVIHKSDGQLYDVLQAQGISLFAEVGSKSIYEQSLLLVQAYEQGKELKPYIESLKASLKFWPPDYVEAQYQSEYDLQDKQC